MKVANDQKTTELVREFAEWSRMRREAEKQEKLLRERLLALIGDDNSLLAGSVLVTVSERSRTDWISDALKILLADQVTEYQKQTTYKVVEAHAA